VITTFEMLYTELAQLKVPVESSCPKYGAVIMYVKGTPIVAVVWAGGFCLITASTGTINSWHFELISV
jgi:hypothetical protein